MGTIHGESPFINAASPVPTGAVRGLALEYVRSILNKRKIYQKAHQLVGFFIWRLNGEQQ
ncbi:MAG: hypothetical protein CXZ00_16225 [Acidobacteria bacterium]|nr:MAG: hypothetical protein CXZ00_16225 [Acidobacteriota bacterium]